MQYIFVTPWPRVEHVLDAHVDAFDGVGEGARDELADAPPVEEPVRGGGGGMALSRGVRASASFSPPSHVFTTLRQPG